MQTTLRERLEKNAVMYVLTTLIGAVIITAGVTWRVMETVWIEPQRNQITQLQATIADLRSQMATSRPNDSQRNTIPVSPSAASPPKTAATFAADALPSQTSGAKISEVQPAATQDSQSQPPVLTQEIDSIAITITKAHFANDSLVFDFQVVNKSPSDQSFNLFGAGSYGNGNSRFMADGQEYAATSIRVGNAMRDGIVWKRYASGIPLNGFVAFKGVPQTLRIVPLLELAYSVDNLKPSAVFRFKNIPVN
jgi:hypothetical protein